MRDDEGPPQEPPSANLIPMGHEVFRMDLTVHVLGGRRGGFWGVGTPPSGGARERLIFAGRRARMQCWPRCRCLGPE
jgi:hypothetical protein